MALHLLKSNRTQVVIGIIKKDDFFLLSQRKKDVHLGGLWEFPGGKVEAFEDLFAALKRELFEEVDIKVISAVPFMHIAHDYPDQKVDLHFWRVDVFEGEAHGKEGQRVQWVHRQNLKDYSTPSANQPVIDALNI